MPLPIQLVSTDFDGTIFAEFEDPPIPEELQKLIGGLQSRGAKWIINTGRDMSSLMEALARARISIEPDCLVLVEREIYLHQDSQYVGLEEWNRACTHAHAELFDRVRADLSRIVAWINARFHARIYEDAYSPFCLIAGNNGDADLIHEYLEDYCRSVPRLTVVRNDVYARFGHAAYNKGTALAELTRRLGYTARQGVRGGRLAERSADALQRLCAVPGGARQCRGSGEERCPPAGRLRERTGSWQRGSSRLGPLSCRRGLSQSGAVARPGADQTPRPLIQEGSVLQRYETAAARPHLTIASRFRSECPPST